jgi:Chromo (CHRromatin Organisation MOdifier) domain
MAKLCPKYFRPFCITKVISPYIYHKLPPHWKIHDIFHVSLLSPYTKTAKHGQNYPKPLLELIDDQPEYEVEQVLSSRYIGCHCKLQYLLRWKGYFTAHNSWEATADANCLDLIQEFYIANPTAVRTLKTKSYINPPVSTQQMISLSSMDLSFINNIHIKDLELHKDTRAALALVNLKDYHPTPDATTVLQPSPLLDHITILLASIGTSSSNTSSPILHAPQPARFIHHHAKNVLDVTS